MRAGVGAGMARGGRILLVEDNPEIAAIIGEFLGDEGYAVATAASVEQALDALAGARYDLVLADALADLAPGGAHWAAVERIRDAAGETPIVICTAHDPARFDDFAARGFAGLIAKPFDLDDLLEPIGRLIGRSRRGPAGCAGKALGG